MSIERTLSIIKPDAVAKNIIGEIYTRFEKAQLRIIAAKMAQLTQDQAKAFYIVHKERPFYNDLVKFMCSGPVMIQVEDGFSPDVIKRLREMGYDFDFVSFKGELREGYGAAIAIDGRRVTAGADPRRAGAAGAIP